MWRFQDAMFAALSDPAVRKAVAHAIDYDLAITSVLGEAGRPMHGFVPRETFGYQEHRYPYDPELAEGLLDEAGWSRNGDGFFEKDGQVLSWTHVSGQHLPQELEVAEAIQTLLREFGIDMSIQALDRVVHTSTMFEHASHAPDGPAPDFGTTQWDHGIRTGDASVALDPIFTCEGHEGRKADTVADRPERRHEPRRRVDGPRGAEPHRQIPDTSLPCQNLHFRRCRVGGFV
jgi:ABC-type transport system substrate-binding protein